MHKVSYLFLILITFCSCQEKKSNVPDQVYKYWSGDIPPKEIHLVHGRYWQSSHWSREYIMYIELEAPAEWRANFIFQNHLVQIKSEDMPPPDPDIPEWFNPSGKSKIWLPVGPNQGSIYFEDSANNKMYLHEVQL